LYGNVSNSNVATAITLAAEKGHSECVKLLIDNHYHVIVNDTDGNTGLIFAAEFGRSKCVKLLMDNHCHVNISSSN
jgi:ankyrin repeat protein